MSKKEIVVSLVNVLKESPLSISQAANELDINWRTAKDYLEILKKLGLLFEKNIKNQRVFFYRDETNYFHLPIKKEHEDLISTLYYLTKFYMDKIHGTNPTRLKANKILWKINKELKYNLPIGWYSYGPCCVKIYGNDEDNKVNVEKEHLNTVRNTVIKYGNVDDFELLQNIPQTLLVLSRLH